MTTATTNEPADVTAAIGRVEAARRAAAAAAMDGARGIADAERDLADVVRAHTAAGTWTPPPPSQDSLRHPGLRRNSQDD